MSFKCSLVTPESQLFDDTITSAVLPAHDGLIGIQTDRAPVLVKLGSGPCTLQLAGKGQMIYFISGGVAQMKDNKLTILTDEASTIDKLDAAAAKKELEDLAKPELLNAATRALKTKRTDRANAILRMAGA